MVKLVVVGKVKSRIKCRAYAELNYKELKELDKEFNDQLVAIFEGEDKPSPELVEAQNVCIELYSREPDISLIKKFFNDEKLRAEELVNHFRLKVAELQVDPCIPKIIKNDTGGNEEDFTTLEQAVRLLFDWKNRLEFVNECIFELGMYGKFDDWEINMKKIKHENI